MQNKNCDETFAKHILPTPGSLTRRLQFPWISIYIVEKFTAVSTSKYKSRSVNAQFTQ
jgi:hypothetical protein